MNMLRTKLAAALCVATLWGGGAHAADVTFMSFTYAEEPNKASVQALLDEIEASQSLAVEPLGYAWGDMQKNILLRARSKTLPDVAQLSERWLPNFANLEAAVDLNKVYGKENLEKAFAPEALAMGRVGDRQLALPLMSGSIGMIANKAVLDKAGVTRIPATIEEFRAALVAVRDKVPNSVPFAMATKNNNSIILDFLIWNWAHGGRVIDDSGKVVVNGDSGRAALGFMTDLMKNRLAAPEIDRPDARRLVGQSASAFYFDAPQARTFLRTFSGQGPAFDANIVPMKTPVRQAGEPAPSIEWGHLLIMFAGSEPKGDAPAAKFLTYLTADEAQTSFTVQQSALPVTRSARAKVESDTYLKAWAQAAGTPRRNEVGIWSNAAELTQIIGEEVQGALLGQKSADAAITAMQSRLEASMAKRDRS